jgi:SAM-dependent methyltransferase
MLRRRAFDAKYNSGTWIFDRADPALNALIERYAAGAEVLILGCGRATIVSHLDPASYSRLVGIDLSPAAIAVANMRTTEKASFRLADMTKEPRSGRYNVVLLPESVYYVSPRALEAFFVHLRRLLAPEGVAIATVAAPKRHAAVIDAIRREFVVLEEDPSRRLVLVFR